MNDNKHPCLVKAKMVLIRSLLLALIVALVAVSLAACSNSSKGNTARETAQPTKEASVLTQASGSIYLYGEAHGQAKILDKEFDLWSEFYHNEGMRHLFVELPYFTAEYLNLWMGRTMTIFWGRFMRIGREQLVIIHILRRSTKK